MHINVLPALQGEKGYQVLHFKSTNKNYKSNKDAVDFVEKHLSSAKELHSDSDADVLRFTSDHTQLDGFFLELGVATGRTINFIAALNPQKSIYGFDSFEGLPEDWVRADVTVLKGAFAAHKNDFAPPVLTNVTLFKGNFADVLPEFKSKILKDAPIAFLHVDCDIYESTKGALDILASNIKEGTIIVFDELYNYPNYAHHEWKALQEFLASNGFKAEFIAFNAEHEQVAIKIIK